MQPEQSLPESQNKEQELLQPGQTLRLENTHIEKIETLNPRFSRIQKALIRLGLIALPKEHYYEKRLQTTYLLVSPDQLAKLQEQIPKYHNDLQKYQEELDQVRANRTVAYRDIARAYRKRQPTITEELERRQHAEIDELNDKLLQSPLRPALLGNVDHQPRIVILGNTNGIGVSLTLEDTRDLSESKHQTGIDVSMLPESTPLTFDNEPMNTEYAYTRGINKNNPLIISTEEGRIITLIGKGPNKLDLRLD